MLTLGIDSSTQGTKAVVYDTETGKVVASAAVNYGRDLPEFGSPDGFLPNGDALVRRADPRMWVKGLDLVLAKLRDAGAPMGEIAAVGGDAQQHATVYLTEQGVEMLKTCALGEVGEKVFARLQSPIWMDSSTGAEVGALDRKFKAALQTRTGSPAIERFAASQVMKFIKEDPKGWAQTARVHLLSSFLTSYLAGADAPIETGDGAGMNLLNLQTLEWDAEVCDFISPELRAKLPAVYLPGAANSLRLAPRFAEFGLKPGIPVAPFTGDNPASLVGCGAEQPGCAVISLGTSDTFFAAMRDFKTDPAGFGHVFGNPMGGFMSLSCFKNGSLARERIKEECGVDWKFFDETAFELTPAGNEGRRAFPYFETEITPKHEATGIEANFDWAAAANETKIRAIVEGQVNNMRERTRWIGDFEKVYVTGGASRSKGIRGVIADLFKAKVETLEVADSAAVGGARLAKNVICALVAVGMTWLASAEWKPTGELQVASSKAMTPQIGNLAANAKFPLLPMIVPQVMGECDLAKKFGLPREDAEWGAKLYVQGDEIEMVWVWPLGKGGLETWKAAHPKRKLVDGVVTYKHKKDEAHEKPWNEYAVFSADGKWACLSENQELAKQVAAGKPEFASPLKKGLACVTMEQPFFDELSKVAKDFDKQVAKVKQGVAEATGGKDKHAIELSPLPDDFPGPALSPFVSAFAKEVQSARALVGVSAAGLDLRFKLVPRAGGALTGASKTLPAAAFEWQDFSDASQFAFIGAPVAPQGELGKTWQALLDEGMKKFIEHSERNLKHKELEKEAELKAFLTSVLGLVKGVDVFRKSSAKCGYFGVSLAEDDDEHKQIRFLAGGMSAPVEIADKSVKARNEGGKLIIDAEDKVAPALKPGKLAAEFKQAVPEQAEMKSPTFAGRWRVGIGGEETDAVVFITAWTMGWRSGEDYRALLRIPTSTLEKAFSSMVQMGGDED